MQVVVFRYLLLVILFLIPREGVLKSEGVDDCAIIFFAKIRDLSIVDVIKNEFGIVFQILIITENIKYIPVYVFEKLL